MFDDIEQELELADIRDQAMVVGKLTPREFAKLAGIAPQLVYYYIRTKKIEVEQCVCGRRVIDVASATKVLQAQEGKRRGGVDSRADHERGS